jgi:hypothetical protein
VSGSGNSSSHALRGGLMITGWRSTVSVNTVKSHVRSIYGKLGVSSHRLAVLTAHERGLLGNQRPVALGPAAATRSDRRLTPR